eukprot:2155150-Prymnesium_polylepis.1
MQTVHTEEETSESTTYSFADRPPFRVRRWPPPAKVFADATRGEHEELPAHRFNEMLDRVEEVRGVRVLDEPSWRTKMWSSCNGIDSPDDLATPEADSAFEQLEVDMREGDAFPQWDPVPEGAERTLVAWLAENDVDVLALLVDEQWLSTGCRLYPPCMRGWQHDSGGEPESLLCIAAKEVCSPRAVRMLLDKGADPNTEFAHLTFNGAYNQTCGPGGLALSDIQGEWNGCFDDKMEILAMLADAGGDTFSALEMYDGREPFEQELAVVQKLFGRECKQRSTAARTRFENVVALVSIVSAWRRMAAAPGSGAAKRARLRFEGGLA